jgi:biopolymer transport protein ExbD
MFVLLIIFMVTAPLMMGVVKINLPKTTGVPMARTDHPLIVSLDANNRVFVDTEPIIEEHRSATFKRLALESESGEIFVRGDGEFKYARMMELMSELGQCGSARVTLITTVLPTTNQGTAIGANPDGPADPLAPPAQASTESNGTSVPETSPMTIPSPSEAGQ